MEISGSLAFRDDTLAAIGFDGALPPYLRLVFTLSMPKPDPILKAMQLYLQQLETRGRLGRVLQKPINANPRIKINQGVYFSNPKCCSTLHISQNFTLEEANLEKTNINKTNPHQKWKT